MPGKHDWHTRSGRSIYRLGALLLAGLWWGGGFGLQVLHAGAPAPIPVGTRHLGEHQIASIGTVTFHSGAVVDDVKVSYVTHGTLSPERDNVVLVMHRFMGDHHDYDFLIGPGKALDTNQYFVVATDFLGNSRLRQDLTTGPTNSGLGIDFPAYSIYDSVTVEHQLLADYLGFEHILAAIGTSMGGMKAYQLAVRHPTFMRGIVSIVGTPAVNPRTRFVLRRMMETIELDPAWYTGRYQTNPTVGLTAALMNLVPWWFVYDWYADNLRDPVAFQRFEQKWRGVFTSQLPQDARDVYYQLQAWSTFDLGATPGFNGDTQAALQAIQVPVLLIGGAGDPLVHQQEIRAANTHIPQATHVEIDSPYGHACCIGVDPEATQVMSQAIRDFLGRLQ